ncbi:MAG: DinB family protein [Gemmatimonadaceae bacterium]
MSLDVEILADQISRAFRGESWHGPSVLEVLAGVSAEDAAAHPIVGAHSIWEIVLHLAGGCTLVLRRLRGEGAQLSPEEEWPPMPACSSEAWRESQQALEELNQQLQRAVCAFPGGTPSAAAGLRVLGVHPVRRHAAARPVSRGSGRPTQEGTRGLARGGLTMD